MNWKMQGRLLHSFWLFRGELLFIEDPETFMYMKALGIPNSKWSAFIAQRDSVIFFRKYHGHGDYFWDKEKPGQRPHMKALGLGTNLFFIWITFVSTSSSQNWVITGWLGSCLLKLTSRFTNCCLLQGHTDRWKLRAAYTEPSMSCS